MALEMIVYINLLFSDSFALTYKGDGTSQNVAVTLLDTSIAWHSDKDVKFGNPDCKLLYDCFDVHHVRWTHCCGLSVCHGFNNGRGYVFFKTCF